MFFWFLFFKCQHLVLYGHQKQESSSLNRSFTFSTRTLHSGLQGLTCCTLHTLSCGQITHCLLANQQGAAEVLEQWEIPLWKLQVTRATYRRSSAWRCRQMALRPQLIPGDLKGCWSTTSTHTDSRATGTIKSWAASTARSCFYSLVFLPSVFLVIPLSRSSKKIWLLVDWDERLQWTMAQWHSSSYC